MLNFSVSCINLDLEYEEHISKQEELFLRKMEESRGCKFLDLYTYPGLVWTVYVQTIFGIFGLIGNSLNISVFGHKLYYGKLGDLEFRANLGFLCLAISDLGYNLFTIPFVYFYDMDTKYPHGFKIALYYNLYGTNAINFFLTLSTWITVVVAVERCLVIRWPIKIRSFLTTKKSIIIFFVVLIICAAAIVPNCIRLKIVPCKMNDKVLYQMILRYHHSTKKLSSNPW